MNPLIKKIRRTSAISLWGSVGIVILAALFLLTSPWRFYPTAYTSRSMLVVATVLACCVISSTLLTVRRRIPQLRQAEALDVKLKGYATHINGIFWSILASVVIISVLAVLSHQSPLLMFAMVATLMLFLTYPNMYRVKTDLGLNDEEMRNLFGDKYFGGDEAQ